MLNNKDMNDTIIKKKFTRKRKKDKKIRKTYLFSKETLAHLDKMSESMNSRTSTATIEYCINLVYAIRNNSIGINERS